MTGQQARKLILELIAEHEKSGTSALIDSNELSQQTGLPLEYIERHLDILARARQIHSYRSHTSYPVKLAPAGWASLESDELDPEMIYGEPANSTARQLRVFLCHASADKTEIQVLYRRLKSNGFDAWLDQENLLPGQDWEREIRNAVRAADLVLVCLSRRSINKAGFVQKEIKFALDVAEEQPDGVIFVIPVRLEDCEVPDRLSKWHWVDLFEDKGYLKLLSALSARAASLRIALQPLSPLTATPLSRDEVIEKFTRSGSFHDAKRNAAELLKCEPFSAAQVDRILIAAITNNQIYLPEELRKPMKILVARYGHLAASELRERFFKIFDV